MTWVYLLRSVSEPHRTYIGRTSNFNARLIVHNAGRSPHTSKYRPWEIVCVVGFATEQKAVAFERYLKDGSGHAFARRHFW